MEESVAKLELILQKLNKARMPTTKAGLGEDALKIAIPLLIEQTAEIHSLRLQVGELCQQ